MIKHQIELWIRNHKHESFLKTLQLNFVVQIFSQFAKHTRVETTSTIVKKFVLLMFYGVNYEICSYFVCYFVDCWKTFWLKCNWIFLVAKFAVISFHKARWKNHISKSILYNIRNPFYNMIFLINFYVCLFSLILCFKLCFLIPFSTSIVFQRC